MKTMKLSVLALALMVTGFMSCTKDDTKESAPAVTKTDSISIPFSTSHYAFFSFKNGAVVPITDSASTNWDFGVHFVTLIVNSHASGPGNAGVITEEGVFDSFTTAPESGYAYDTTSTQLAIDDGLTTGWYNYDDATHSFSPKAGRFFVFKTTDNHYVKMEITGVDYSGFIPPNPPTTLIYKIRYTYQADGSRNLK